MLSTMQDGPLTIPAIVRHGRQHFPNHVVVTYGPAALTRSTFGEIVERSERLARVLAELGIGEGDRVATLCWNHAEHMEAYVAVPSMAAVLLTLNIRLYPDQLRQIASHAEPRALIVDQPLLGLAESLIGGVPSLKHVLVVGESYDEALATAEAGFEWPEIDERAAASMCYTTGTTGPPKGVVYSHRSTYLHSLACAAPNAFALGDRDRILLIVPMFHAAGWGLPYTALFMGCDLLMPREFLQGQHLAAFAESEQATFAAGVPTVLDDLLRQAQAGNDLSSLRLLVGGGAAVPSSLIEQWAELGIELIQGWGMTETSPLAALARPPRGSEKDMTVRARTGRAIHGVELRIVDAEGRPLPADGASIGEIEVRGPWVTGTYYQDPAPDRFRDGWLRTGDVGFLDKAGYVQITDRLKDVIKSGGEWISSIDLERALADHPAVLEAAVIGIPDQRWTERPLALVVPREGAPSPSADDLRTYLRERVARWWVPESWAFVDEIPKTSVGKIDKKLLRDRAAAGRLGVIRVVADKETAAASFTKDETPS